MIRRREPFRAGAGMQKGSSDMILMIEALILIGLSLWLLYGVSQVIIGIFKVLLATTLMAILIPLHLLLFLGKVVWRISTVFFRR